MLETIANNTIDMVSTYEADFSHRQHVKRPRCRDDMGGNKAV